MNVLRGLVLSAAAFLLISCVICSQISSNQSSIEDPQFRHHKKHKSHHHKKHQSHHHKKHESHHHKNPESHHHKNHESHHGLNEQSVFRFGHTRKDDINVSVRSGSKTYEEIQDGQFKIRIPYLDCGVISFVHLVVQTDSGDCTAKIVKGGIGTNHMVIKVKVYSTIGFSWTCRTYALKEDDDYCIIEPYSRGIFNYGTDIVGNSDNSTIPMVEY